jgi:predicted DCC family thiol-disulfide oxidoreductase YuxK
MFDKQTTHIVYDGECPFCTRYVKLLRLRAASGPIVLVNAREPHPAVDYVESRGVALDNEMALVIGGEVYAGPECINRLALMSTSSGAFNRINAFIFASPRRSDRAYPAMRFVRNFTLRLLRRPPIRSEY